jgi:DNA polymerase-1
MRLAFDLEADGLEPTRIWCIVAKDVDSEYIDRWTINSTLPIQTFLHHALSRADELIGHNIIEFDLPVLQRLTGWAPPDGCKISDTLVLSRLSQPDREGAHSLRAWGDRLGLPKGDHKDWSEYSDDMLRYCRRDVDVTCEVYRHLATEWVGLPEAKEAVDLERSIATIIQEQEANGFKFDCERAIEYVNILGSLIRDIDSTLRLPTYKETVPGREVSSPFRMDGLLKRDVAKYLAIGDDNYSLEHSCVSGPFCKVSFAEFNPESVHHMKDWLLENGWEPDQHTPKGAPQLTETSLMKMGPIGESLIKRGTYVHRLRQIQGLLDRVRSEDSRVGAGANPCGTPTGRMRHRNVVNIPKVSTFPKQHERAGDLLWHSEPGVEQAIPFGTEIRSLFTVPQDKVLVGYDAKGLELRVLAHYIGDEAYIKELLDGDAHTFTQQAAGLPSRDAAKTFIYAFVYGAGFAKLGSIVGGGYTDGKRLAEKFYQTIPGLRRLVDGVQRAAKRGYLVGLDGRHLTLRSEHKALNTLIQGGGAVCMKKIAVLLDSKIDKTRCMKVCDMHDEAQIECDPDYVQELTELIHESFVECTRHFNLRIPLEADVKTGKNWAETH